jgi:hypothetical protein
MINGARKKIQETVWTEIGDQATIGELQDYVDALVSSYGRDANLVDTYGDFGIEVLREETDEEYEARVLKEMRKEERELAKKLKLFEKLKEELGEKKNGPRIR